MKSSEVDSVRGCVVVPVRGRSVVQFRDIDTFELISESSFAPGRSCLLSPTSLSPRIFASGVLAMSGGLRPKIHVYDSFSGRLLRSIIPHKPQEIMDSCAIPRSHNLGSGDCDVSVSLLAVTSTPRIEIFDCLSGKGSLLPHFDSDSPTSITYAPWMRSLCSVTNAGRIHCFDLDALRVSTSFSLSPRSGNSLSLESASSRQLIVAATTGGEVAFYDVREDPEQSQVGRTLPVRSGFSQRCLVNENDDTITVLAGSGEIFRFDLRMVIQRTISTTPRLEQGLIWKNKVHGSLWFGGLSAVSDHVTVSSAHTGSVAMWRNDGKVLQKEEIREGVGRVTAMGEQAWRTKQEGDFAGIDIKIEREDLIERLEFLENKKESVALCVVSVESFTTTKLWAHPWALMLFGEIEV